MNPVELIIEIIQTLGILLILAAVVVLNRKREE